jgi:hypothetical protein
MNFLKNVWADLVERKLWPVAVALLVALVAVPVVLGRGGGDSAASATGAAPAHTGAPAGQLVSLSTTKPKGAPLGPKHNPFRKIAGGSSPVNAAAPADAHAPVVTTIPANGGTPSGSSIPTAPSRPSAPSAPSPTGPVTRPPSDGSIGGSKPPASTPRGDTTPRSYAAGYRVDVTYGRQGDLNPHGDLARLDPLSALKAPLVLFLGVKDDGKSAVFTVLADAAVSGDGVCRPSPKDCQVVGLKPGDAELFDVASGGRALRYELQVDKVARRTVSSAQASLTARHRESSAGRSLLRKAISASKNSYVTKYRYAAGKGVVTKVMPRSAG